MNKALILSSFFLLISGCMVGPDHKRPCVKMGDHFIEKPSSETINTTENHCKWWKQFEDPLLDGYILEAVKNNYDIRIAKQRIQELRAMYRMEAVELFPKIDATGQAKKVHISKNLFAPNRPTVALDKIFQIGFDASWELDFFGKIRRSKQAALYSLQASCEEMRNTQITIMAEVARLYIDIRNYQNKISLTKKQIDALGKIDSLTNDKYQAGIADKRDAAQAKANLEKAKSSLPLLIAEEKKAMYTLAFFLSRKMGEIEQDFAIIQNVPDAVGKIPNFLPSDLLKRRPDIRQAERELASQTSKIGVAKADLFPQFSLTGSFSWLSQRTSNWLNYDSRQWYVGPDLKWPILYFGRIRSNIRMETAKQKQTFTNYEKIVLNSIKEVESSLADYFNQTFSQESTLEEVLSLKSKTTLQEDIYSSGVAEYSSLLTLQNELYEKEKDLIESQSMLATKLIALYKALGGDWECSDMP